MLPTNSVTPVPQAARFSSPYGLPFSPLSHACRGGIALNDGSKGRDVKDWYVWYEGGEIKYGPKANPLVALGSLTVPNVRQLSMAFDNNMNPLLCWLDLTGAHLRYFSGATSTYVTVDIPGATSCLVAVDDARNFYNANSDAVFAYTLATGLWFRYQRQNYGTAYPVSASAKRLVRLGMGAQGRFQFETVPY